MDPHSAPPTGRMQLLPPHWQSVAAGMAFCFVAGFAIGRGSNAPHVPDVPNSSAPSVDSAMAPNAKPAANAPILTDPKAMDEKYGNQAQAACSAGAEDYLRQTTKYEFKWDDDARGFMGVKFDKVATPTDTAGVLDLISTRLLIQNGLGAFGRDQISCQYDTQADKVLEYELGGVAIMPADGQTPDQKHLDDSAQQAR